MNRNWMKFNVGMLIYLRLLEYYQIRGALINNSRRPWIFDPDTYTQNRRRAQKQRVRKK